MSFVDTRTELKRLLGEVVASQDADPYMLATIVIESHDLPTTKARLTELLQIVLQYRIDHPIDYENEAEDDSIDEELWRESLPGWFLNSTPFLRDDIRNDFAESSFDKDRWTVESWLYWFISPHEERAWRWFSLTEYPRHHELLLEIEDVPFLWGALKWSIDAAGGRANIPD